MKFAYYNEIDLYCAEWLRNLIKSGHIPDGEVDTRSIEDVCGNDLKEYGQCHFFAGIGGWAYACRLAGLLDDDPGWTGSCPCQPFSIAGKATGMGDERHLWPAFHRLIAERRPARIFGEQVASKDGRLWLSGVRIDLENLGYAVGAADLCAAGIGMPHIRQRLWWVANARSASVARFKQARESLHVAGGKTSTKHCNGSIPARIWNAADTCPPLWANVLPRPVDIVRAFGNSICPELAAEFIMASREAM